MLIEAPYERLLIMAANWIPKEEKRILDMKCNQGEFAHLLKARLIDNYVGFDNNSEYITNSKLTMPKYKFMCSDIQDNLHYFRKMTLIVAFNYLQCVKDDLALINNIKPDTKLVFSVTNYDKVGFYRSNEIDGWQDRFKDYIDISKIITFQNPNNEDQRTFLFKATRNDYVNEESLEVYRHVTFDMTTKQVKGTS